MQKMQESKVLLVGLRGVGAEVGTSKISGLVFPELTRPTSLQPKTSALPVSALLRSMIHPQCKSQI